MLKVNSIEASYGKVQALRDVTLEVSKGEIVALLGANGAGKTTTLRTISGLLKPNRGTIEFLGTKIDGTKPEAIVKSGLVHVPEGRKIFPGLTVKENLFLGGAIKNSSMKAMNKDVEYVFSVFPELERFADKPGWSLSGGQQQMLAIGRGLMAKPKLLLLDEPSLGLAPVIIQQVFKIIRDINSKGTTVLLVEQNAYMALRVATRGYVIENGRIVLSDTSSNLIANPAVQSAYLGGEH
ncbi:ABC transporter ATP-binding protein [Paradesulfitobacterium aromaticivorans]